MKSEKEFNKLFRALQKASKEKDDLFLKLHKVESRREGDCERVVKIVKEFTKWVNSELNTRQYGISDYWRGYDNGLMDSQTMIENKITSIRTHFAKGG